MGLTRGVYEKPRLQNARSRRFVRYYDTSVLTQVDRCA